MRKFILKSLLFLSPLISIIVVNFVFEFKSGDLIRIGYLLDRTDYKKPLIKGLDTTIYYTKISELNLEKKHNFNVLTIGDSFSQQGFYGYKNFLAKDMNLLHYDRKLHNNPIQTIISLLNGNFFDFVNVDFVILQSVERHSTTRAQKINFQDTISIKKLRQEITNQQLDIKTSESLKKNSLFTDKIFKTLLTNIQYQYEIKPTYSKTYKVNTSEQLFSKQKNQLLFYEDDLRNVQINNSLDSVKTLNATLNKISRILKIKGAKLIFIPAPDKYDLYYNYITNNNFPKPLFFYHMENLEKDYIWVNTKEILSELILSNRDIYFYGDTHWSPIASKEISNRINKLVNENN